MRAIRLTFAHPDLILPTKINTAMQFFASGYASNGEIARRVYHSFTYV
jgi:hypothetical protein